MTRAYLLADRDKPLAVSQKAGKVTVELPAKAPDPDVSVLCEVGHTPVWRWPKMSFRVQSKAYAALRS